MPEKLRYTLKNLGTQIYSSKNKPPIIRKIPKYKELKFFEAIFPSAFLEGPRATLFADYEERNNPTRNKIFNGTYHGDPLQSRTSAYFTGHPGAWQGFVDHCTQEVGCSSCDHDRLRALLLDLTEKMPACGVSEELCQQTREACIQAPGEALAIITLFVMLHSNETGNHCTRGDINFLLPVIFTTRARYPQKIAAERPYADCCMRYLKERFRNLLTCPQETFDEVYQKHSRLFSCVAEVTPYDETENKDDLLEALYNRIMHTDDPYLLYVKGPAGAHKNSLMQLLFLKLLRSGQRKYIPFYIDLNYYEKYGLNGISLDDLAWPDAREQIICQFDNELSAFCEFCQQHPQQKPLLLIDSIRNYNQGMPLDCFLDVCPCVQKLKDTCCYIEDMDMILTENLPRHRKEDRKVWAHRVEFHSVDLSSTEETERFLSCYSALYKIPAGLREMLKRLPFYTIDSYQLHLLSKTLENSRPGYQWNIADLYEQFCVEYLQYDQEKMDQAAKEAYHFAYTDDSLPALDYYTSSFWILLRKHASFLDFFIARYYVAQMKRCSKTGDVSALDIILPKTITRFVLPQITGSISREEMVISLARDHYAHMGPYGQSELTYWLGRLTLSNQKNNATQLLRRFLLEQEKTIEEKMVHPNYYSEITKKEDLFLLRGIMVSLIYQGCRDISDKYISTLLDDNLAAEINRGFHLEYYGDIAYLPNARSLNYTDNIRLGEKTLKQLFLICNTSAFEMQPAFELSLFTICSLIQARIEKLPLQTQFPLRPYLVDLENLLQKRLASPQRMGQKLEAYYRMVLQDCQAFLRKSDSSGPLSARLFQYYSGLSDIPRTGWKGRGIPSPESLAEHMYSTWLMAFLMLPDTYSGAPDYNKQSIMKLLLIHDMGERTTGDIPRPQKNLDREKYDRIEDYAMSSLLLKGTYPQMGRMDQEYTLWKEWEQNASNINALIAKDIDTVQAAYQLCCYMLKYEDHFSRSDVTNWLSEYFTLKTDLCRDFFRTLIFHNPAFAPLHLEELVLFTN